MTKTIGSTKENIFLIVLQTHLLHICLKSEIFQVLYCKLFGTNRLATLVFSLHRCSLFPYAHKSNLNGLIGDKCSWKRSFVFKTGTGRQRETERKKNTKDRMEVMSCHDIGVLSSRCSQIKYYGLIGNNCSCKIYFVFKAGTGQAERDREKGPLDRMEVSYYMASNTFHFNDNLKAIKNMPPSERSS